MGVAAGTANEYEHLPDSSQWLLAFSLSPACVQGGGLRLDRREVRINSPAGKIISESGAAWAVSMLSIGFHLDQAAAGRPVSNHTYRD